jgi:hypothetical protein
MRIGAVPPACACWSADKPAERDQSVQYQARAPVGVPVSLLNVINRRIVSMS